MGMLVLLLAGSSFAAPEPGDKTPTGTKDQVLKRFVEELVEITPGKGRFPAAFTMGSATSQRPDEQPPREVKLGKPFAMSRYEVTQELYQHVTGQDPSRWKGPRNSVEMVDWNEAVAFCQKLTNELRQRKLIADNEIIRLPSEAEWEYCCRAGTTTAYSFGDDPAQLRDHGWFDGNAKGEDPPVGKKKPNAWGLYDLHGYVWEWCQDAWHDTYAEAPSDGSAWSKPLGEFRVARGGSWGDSAERCRSAARLKAKASEKNDRIGFRCVKAAEGN
jgi:formylglycine-generating enzyme required for sulfatase activity